MSDGHDDRSTLGELVLDAPGIADALAQIASQLAADNATDPANLLILGLQTRGVPLAARLAKQLATLLPGFDPARQLGQLDVTMYRDDLRHNLTRTLGVTQIPTAGLDGREVVLVDDVLYSGRTARAALDAVTDLGRPRAIRLVTLIDRGHRELPIRPDYVGRNVSAPLDQRVWVQLAESDGVDAVWSGPRGQSGTLHDDGGSLHGEAR